MRGQAEGRAWGGGAPHTRGEGSVGTEGDRPAGGGEGSRQGKVLSGPGVKDFVGAELLGPVPPARRAPLSARRPPPSLSPGQGRRD